MTEFGAKVVEIFPKKNINTNVALTLEQEKQLIHTLEEFSDRFSWEFTHMRGIHPNTCIHHIYIEGATKPVRQPQRRINPSLREIAIYEL